MTTAHVLHVPVGKLGAFTNAAFSTSAPSHRLPRIRNPKIVYSVNVKDEIKQGYEGQQRIQDEDAVPSGKQKIYIGRGAFVIDDPNKYPDRTPLTGGFAGGEVGLKEFVAEVGKDEAVSSTKTKTSSEKASSKGRSDVKKGLYVGSGRYLPDDPKSNKLRAVKQTGRDSPLTGGFAGGEIGLQKYVETGEVPFAPEGSRRRQQSPLIIAGIVSAAAVTGGVLLTDVSDFGESLFRAILTSDSQGGVALSEDTKTLLQIALIVSGVAFLLVGTRALVKNVQQNVSEGAEKLVKFSLFWLVVFFIGKLILDSP